MMLEPCRGRAVCNQWCFSLQELLYHRHLHVNTKKIEESGFQVKFPELRLEHLREVVEDFVACKQFPQSLLPPQA